MQSFALAFAASIAGGGGDRRGDGQLLIIGVGDRAGGVRCGHRGLLGAQQHLGTHVLDGLEAADRLAELLANLRVLGGGPQRPAGQPGGLRRQHRRGQVLDPLPRHRQHLGGRGVEHHACQRAGEVGGGQRFDDHTVGGRRRPAETCRRRAATAPRPDRRPAQIRRCRTPGRRGIAGPRVSATPAVRSPDASASSTSAWAPRNDERSQRRGGNRAGYHRGGGLVDHRAQVIGAAPGAAQLLGDRDAEDP